MLRLLIIDNYDSFTWNLAHLAASLTGEMPSIVRNDEWPWERIAADAFDAIIISPGPGHPANSRDFGVSAEVIRHSTVPVLGICLGHQGIALEYGAEIQNVEPVHGQVYQILHIGDKLDDALFRGVPAQFNAVRYHSLAVKDPLPDCLQKTAWTADGTIMALRHISRPLWGVQFHPESILSEHGSTIIGNFLGNLLAR